MHFEQPYSLRPWCIIFFSTLSCSSAAAFLQLCAVSAFFTSETPAFSREDILIPEVRLMHHRARLVKRRGLLWDTGCFVHVSCDSVKLAPIWTYCINQRSNVINYDWAAQKLHTSERRALALLVLMGGTRMSKMNSDTAMNCAWLLSSPAIHHHHHMLGGKGKRFTKEGSEQCKSFIHLYFPLFGKRLKFCLSCWQWMQNINTEMTGDPSPRKREVICQAM